MPLLLSRRQTLKSLATAAAFSTGLGGTLFGLAGCGGSGGGGSAGGAYRAGDVAVKVSLPAGSATPALDTLSVWTSGGTQVPAADGTAKARIINGGPQYAEARDASGRLVAFGFVGDGRSALDATSTAELLAYFALGAGALAPEGRMAVLNGVKGLNGFQAIADAVSAQIAGNGQVTRDGEVAIAIEAFLAANPKGEFRGRAGHSRGTLVEPDAEASGLILDTLVDGELKLTNNYLRRSYAWLERTGWKNADGSVHEGLLEIEQFDIAVPARYGGFTGVVGDIIAGEYIWAPVTMPTRKIPIAPADAIETYYRLTTVGIGAEVADYANLSQERKDIRDTVTIKALVFDLLLPVISNIVLPLKGGEFDEFVEHADANTVMSDAINLLRETVPQLLELLNAGQYKDAAYTLWKSAWTTNSMLPIVSALILNFVKERLYDKYNYEQIEERFYNTLGVFGAVDITASVFDTGLMIHDWAQCNHADIIKITSRKGKITVIPDLTEAQVTSAVNVRTVIQDKNPEAVYRYEWSVNAGYLLTAPDGKTTDAASNGVLMSNYDAVALTSKGTSAGTAIVACTVTRIDGEPDQRIDSKTATVAFRSQPIRRAASVTVRGFLDDRGNGFTSPLVAVILSVEPVPGVRGYSIGYERPDGSIATVGGFQANESLKELQGGVPELWVDKPEDQIWKTGKVYVSPSTYGASTQDAAQQELDRTIEQANREYPSRDYFSLTY